MSTTPQAKACRPAALNIHDDATDSSARHQRKSSEMSAKSIAGLLLSVTGVAVTEWLLALHPDTSARVWLSWQPDTAVSTTWGIFSRYWGEFCYPVSDDVLVWSKNFFWVLLYHHEEHFQHGVRI